jgi:copper homeostasis protein CutC
MGVSALNRLVEKVDASKYDIIIMPGCGIKKENLKDIVKHSGAVEFHASASVFENVPVYLNKNCSMGTQDEKAFVVDQKTVAYMATVVKCLNMDGKPAVVPDWVKVDAKAT